MIKKKYIGLIIITCILLFMLSAYPTTIHYYLQGQPSDLTPEQFQLLLPYTFSRIQIWYSSFQYHHLFLLFLIPIITAFFYLKSKIIGYDFLIIQRTGFKKYFGKSFFKLLLISIIIACIPLLWYIILQLLPLNNEVAFFDLAIPSVEPIYLILDNGYLDNFRDNINIVYYYPLIRMIIVVILYSIFSYSIQLHFKNMALGIITPIILICVFDIISSTIFNKSFYFDLYNTTLILPFQSVLYYATFILSISFTSMFIHYYLRKHNV